MSFDGVLLASCVMVAKEAYESFVEDIIVAAKSVANAEWEGTYSKETGGVEEKLSLPLETIHFASTHGAPVGASSSSTIGGCRMSLFLCMYITCHD